MYYSFVEDVLGRRSNRKRLPKEYAVCYNNSVEFQRRGGISGIYKIQQNKNFVEFGVGGNGVFGLENPFCAYYSEHDRFGRRGELIIPGGLFAKALQLFTDRVICRFYTNLSPVFFLIQYYGYKLSYRVTPTSSGLSFLS